jgi:hypothetical protein
MARAGRWPNIALTAQLANAFALIHVSGDKVQHVQIEPIQSSIDRSLWIRFDSVDSPGGNRSEAYPDFRLDMGGYLRGERDMGKVKAVFFLRDAWGKDAVDHP